MGLTVLEEYIETGNHQELEVLLTEQPKLVYEKTSHDISPLLLSCYYQKDKVTQILLRFLQHITIHEACATGLYEQIERMLSNKPDVMEEFSSHGFTPLSIASHFGHTNVVHLLLKHGADPNISSKNGYHVYPLHVALTENHTDIAKLLIEAGAHINIVQANKLSPLHLAAQYGNIEIIILLLENGIDIRLTNDLGQTASEIALEKGYPEIAEILKV